jgi:hypothetical protein
MSAVTSLSRADPSVDPGGQSAITIKIRNSGSIVDRFDVDVVGPTTGWVRVEPVSLSLFPGVEGTVTITFAPPRASTPRAGIHPFGIRVRPAADPAGSTVEEGRITVTPFTSVAADIVPQTSRGPRVGHHQVIVVNRGNAPSDVAVTAEDPDRRLKLSVQPPRAVVAPEARVEFGVRVEVDDPFPFGQVRQRPFQVSVEPGRQQPIALRGTLNQRPMLPGWIPPLAGVIGVVALLSVGAFLVKAGPFAEAPSPTPIAIASPSPTAEPTASPSAAPTEAPSASEAASQPPSAPPPPSAPEAHIAFQDWELQDLAVPSDGPQAGVTAARLNPRFAFTTDSTGPVTFTLDLLSSNAGQVNLCLRKGTDPAQCKVVNGPDTVSIASDTADKTAWTAFVRAAPDAQGNLQAGVAPLVNVSLDFFATNPQVIWTDNAVFQGDPTPAGPIGYYGFTAQITARSTKTLAAVGDFGGVFTTFALSAYDLTAAPPPMTTPLTGTQFALGSGGMQPLVMSADHIYAFRFVGQAPPDQAANYTVTIGW